MSLLLLLLMLVTPVEGFDMTWREWSVLVIGPYLHKGRVQYDIPQHFTGFKTLKECQAKRDAMLAVPPARVLRDCFDPELPSADSFPAPWKAQP